jgi:hypothetical protein
MGAVQRNSIENVQAVQIVQSTWVDLAQIAGVKLIEPSEVRHSRVLLAGIQANSDWTHSGRRLKTNLNAEFYHSQSISPRVVHNVCARKRIGQLERQKRKGHSMRVALLELAST